MRIGLYAVANRIEVALPSPGGNVLFDRRAATCRSHWPVFDSLVPPIDGDSNGMHGAARLRPEETRR